MRAFPYWLGCVYACAVFLVSMLPGASFCAGTVRYIDERHKRNDPESRVVMHIWYTACDG
jgi:hypothetical protein